MRWHATGRVLPVLVVLLPLSTGCDDYLYSPIAPTPVDYYPPAPCSARLTVRVIDAWNGFPLIDARVTADDVYDLIVAYTDGAGAVTLHLAGETYDGACVRGAVSADSPGYHPSSRPYDLWPGDWGDVTLFLEPW